MGLTKRRRSRLVKLLVELRWRRYHDDPYAFFSECVQVPAVGTRTGRAPFVLHDYQEDGLRALMEDRFVIVLKARQLGWTTLMMAVALWELLFKPGTNILLVSKDQRTADKALGEMLDFMYSFLPEWVRDRGPTLESDSAREHVWVFPDGMRSRIVSLPATKTAGAGETATRVIWDEAALAEEQEDTYRTLLPTTDAGGGMVIFSTARGAHNRFAKLFREAQQGKNGFRPLFNPWTMSRLLNPLAGRMADCPACDGTGMRGEAYCRECVDVVKYEAKRRDFRDTPWRFFAEYPSSPDEAFRQSGRSRFPNMPPVEEFDTFPLRGRLVEENGRVRFVEDEAGWLRLRDEARHGAPTWSKPVVSVDPASGGGGDYTAMSAGWIDRDGEPQRMAFWHSNEVEPVAAAREAALLGRFFAGSGRAAMLAVEKQGGYGDSLIHELNVNCEYPNLYVHRYSGHRKRRAESTFGFPMTATRRPLVIDRLAQWVPDVTDPDRPVLGGIDPLLRHELGAFVQKDDGRVEADVGMHDDLVMSVAIWLYVLVEDVGAATVEAKGEEAPAVQRFTLDAMWEDIERARRVNERDQRREQRRMVRQMSRGRR